MDSNSGQNGSSKGNTPQSKASSKNRRRTYSRDADVSSEDEEKKKLLNSNSKTELQSLIGKGRYSERNFVVANFDLEKVEANSPCRFVANRSPWTNMSTTCEASEDEIRDRSETSSPQVVETPAVSPPPSIQAQFPLGTFPPSVASNGSSTNIQVPEPARVAAQHAADLVRRLSQPTLVPLITPMVPVPQAVPQPPPSPGRLQLKESIELDPPSPGRLVLKGEVQDEPPSPDLLNKRRKSQTKLEQDLEEMAKLQAKIRRSKTPTAPAEKSDFDRKPLEKIKLYPQKRVNTLDSPTLREIANQNAKKLRVDESPTSSQEPSVRHKSARNSPSAAAVIAEPDKYSEVATLGDPDEIGSIASLSSINERLIETKETERPERPSRPVDKEPENEGTPWITSLKEKDINLDSFKQLTASRREFATRLDNYLRGCVWAPDGLCLLSNSNDNVLRLFNLPHALLTGRLDNCEPEMESVLQIPEGEAVYDFAWWPRMNSMDPPTCCFVSTAKSQPIHLFDAFTGKLRATYRIINHLDEIATAHSVCFSNDGIQLLAGLDGECRMFDTSVPGKESSKISLAAQGQKGIISTMVMSPDNVLAMGTYNKHIGLYDAGSGQQIQLLDSVHQGGVTSLKFMPNNSNQLVSAARKCELIKCWDLRSMTRPVWTVSRACTTNQRIQFDISSNGKTLMSGSTEGKLHFWSLSAVADPVEVKSIEAHRSATNAVSLHPFAPICASGSGQRVFPNVADSDSEDTMTAMPVSDNSLTLWTAFNY